MVLFSMKIDNLQELFIEQLRDLYDGEQQITEALPKLIEKATNPELKNALKEHLDVTKQQVSRLEQIFRGLNEKTHGRDLQGNERRDQRGRRCGLEGQGSCSARRKHHCFWKPGRALRNRGVRHGEDLRSPAQPTGIHPHSRTNIERRKRSRRKKLSQLAESINIEAKAA
jgi:hypothetical protein